MDRDSFRAAPLQIMERRLDSADWVAPRGLVPADRRHVHMKQEYTRDFPILHGPACVQRPIPAVCQELVENLCAQERGGLLS